MNITDYFVLAFDYHYKNTHSAAKEDVKKKIISEREGMADLMIKVGNVLDLHGDKTVPDLGLRRESEEILPSNQREIVAKYLKSIDVDEETYYWEYIDSIKEKNLKLLRKLFKLLNFVEPSSKLVLFNQALKLKSELESENRCLTFDDRLILKKNRAHLHDDEKTIISHRAEYYTYRLIAGRLYKTHWGVENSSEFSPLEESLVNSDQFEKNGDSMIEAINSVNLNMPIEELLARKRERFNILKKRVIDRIGSRDNESVILSTASGKKTWTVKQLKGRNEVNDRIFLSLPKVGISSVIAIVARETGFYERIRHMKYRQKDAEFSGKFISCLIANATRLGVHKMADLCPFTYDVLKNFEANFLRTPALENAADCISDEITKLGIFKYYNFRSDVIHGSIDGQKFGSKRNTVRTRYSSKDFGKGKGLSALTLSVNHVPVNVGIMPLNHHESHYTFDLLYNNTSQLQPDVVSTDTHGTNKCNFALLDLFGWTFAPRYRDVGSELGKLFSVTETKNGFSIELAKPIEDQKIIEGWRNTQRICVSLHQKEVRQYEIVKKISRSTESDKMLDALKEYDRLNKAIYLLEYIDDDNLKRYVQKALNMGEACHQLQRAISKVNGQSNFRGKGDREIDVWYSCARLLANCTIFYNSALMSNALTRFEKENKDLYAETLKKISPVAWEHLVFNGEYPLDDIIKLPSILDLSRNILNE
jgi:TnpA family transposase